MFGAYGVGTDHFISTTTSEDLGHGIIGLERVPAFDSATNPTLSFLADNNHDRAWAVFGNVEYDVTKQLELGFALRYDDDHREQLVSPYNTAGSQNDVNHADFNKVQPKATIRYTVDPDLQFYASWGVGFRSGQFNQNGVGVAAASVGLIGVSDVAKAEVDTSYEGGFKSQWFGRRLTLDGAVFHTDAQNVQYFVFVAPISAQVLVNIDKVSITGGEVEANLRLLGGFSANAGLGITHTEITKYSLTPGDVGNKAPFVPDATGNIGLQYATPVADKFRLTARVDEEIIGKQYWDPENDTARKTLYLLSARVAVATIEKRWELSVFGKNLTNVLYNEEYGGGGFAYPANPRSFGAALRYSF
jgi:iron complex outermembrane receptor protein